MHILGISTLGRSSAVALINEHSVLFAIEEEKLGRQESSDIPRLAMARCLHENQLKLSNCRAIALAERSASPPGSRRKSKRLARSLSQLQLQNLLRGGPRLSPFDHHLCHAASAYYASGFDRALKVSLDEGANSQSGMILEGDGDELRTLETLKFPDSLGWFYSRVTELAGQRPHKDEHKIQWLSKGGEPEYLPVFRKLFTWKASGLPALNRRYFESGPDHRGIFSPQFYRELGLSSRGQTPNPVVRANLARSAQDYLEELVLELAANCQEETGTQSLCLAGGIFLNVLLVRALETRGDIEHVYVQPVSGNAGTALGAAYLSRQEGQGAFRPRVAPQPGAGYASNSAGNESRAGQFLRLSHWRGPNRGRSSGTAATREDRSLVPGAHGIWPSRFGQSQPAGFAVFGICNRECQLVHQIFTRPVAGLERFAFHGNAVRVHTVEKRDNPLFWKPLNKFGEFAPAPILVNTSFNLFGEPLVTDPRGAVRSFYCVGVDALALGPFLLVKWHPTSEKSSSAPC